MTKRKWRRCWVILKFRFLPPQATLFSFTNIELLVVGKVLLVLRTKGKHKITHWGKCSGRGGGHAGPAYIHRCNLNWLAESVKIFHYCHHASYLHVGQLNFSVVWIWDVILKYLQQTWPVRFWKKVIQNVFTGLILQFCVQSEATNTNKHYLICALKSTKEMRN